MFSCDHEILFLHVEVIGGESFGKTTSVHIFVSVIDVEDDFLSPRLAVSNEKQKVFAKECSG
jgi:hypothetical protein